MKLWHRHAQRLPIRVRPFQNETVHSYTRRLSHANDLKSPSTILRALGEPTRPSDYLMFADHDAALNEPALARLEIFTGIPRDRLSKALPALRSPVSDGNGDKIPMVRPYRIWEPRIPCQSCARRIPGQPTIVIRPEIYPLICARHRRWTATSGDHYHQADLTQAPEIVAAHHKYTRLRAALNDDQWTHRQLDMALAITAEWARRPLACFHLKRLPARWEARAKVLGIYGYQTPARVFPEAVILAQILSDLEWRRHLAIKPGHSRYPFFKHVGQRLGENPRHFAGALLSDFLRPRDEPLTGWINSHRATHRQARDDYLKDWPRNPRTPLPEIRHFK